MTQPDESVRQLTIEPQEGTRICANMGCFRMFTAREGKLYHSRLCAARAAARRRVRDYTRLVSK